MMKKFKIIFYTAIILFFAMGTALSYASQVKYHEYTDSKKPLMAHTGSKVLISLKADKNAGYLWKLKKMPSKKILRFLNSRYISAGSKLSGTSGKVIWSFQAVGRGRAKVPFSCTKPAKKGKTFRKQEIFTVIVK